MKNLLLTVSVLFTIPFTLSAQDFGASVKSLMAGVKTVKLEKETLDQSLSLQGDSPTALNLKVVSTDPKGKSTIEQYQFDLIFFEQNGVSFETTKKEMFLEFKTLDGLNVIKFTENGESKNYQDKFKIRVDNADEGRELLKFAKASIAATKTKFESTVKIPTTYPELLKFVQSQLTDFDENGINVVQNVQKTSNFSDRTLYASKVSVEKKIDDQVFDFSWADLSESSVKMEISGKRALLNAVAADKKEFILITDNVKKKSSFEKELNFILPNPLRARILGMAIQKLIPLAKKELALRTEKPKVVKPEFLTGKFNDFERNGTNYTQALKGNCQMEYNSGLGSKGKSSEEKYVFNFGDLSDFKLTVKSDHIEIEGTTANKYKFINYQEKDSKVKFVKDVSFKINDVETSREMMLALPVFAAACKQNVKSESFDWIQKTLKEAGLDDYSQSLELIDGNKSRWKLTTEKKESKKTTSLQYEFNIADLDLNTTDYDADGSQLVLEISCKGKEKLIKEIKEDKPSFTNKLLIYAKDAETIKKINASIKSLAAVSK